MTTPTQPKPIKTLYMIPEPITTFSLMERLPAELQQRVYTIATIDHPARNMQLQPKVRGNIVPPMLHTCSISRSIAQKMHARFTISARQYGVKFAIQIDFDKDRLVVGDSCIEHVAPGSRMRGLQAFGDIAVRFTKVFSEVRHLTLHQRACELRDSPVDDFWLVLLMGPRKLALTTIMEMCPQLRDLTIILDASHGTVGAPRFSVEAVDPYRYMARFQQEIEHMKMSESESDGVSDRPSEVVYRIGKYAATLPGESTRLRIRFMVENDPYMTSTYPLPLYLYL